MEQFFEIWYKREAKLKLFGYITFVDELEVFAITFYFEIPKQL